MVFEDFMLNPIGSPHPGDGLVASLRRTGPLSADDEQLLLDLPFRKDIVRPGQTLVREGDPAQHGWLVRSGVLIGHKTLSDGGRQIVALYLPGDLVGFHHLIVAHADHAIQAIGEVELDAIAATALRSLIFSSPTIVLACWRAAAIDIAVRNEWLASLGRRDARGRVAHILSEYSRRCEARGHAEHDGVPLPLTQEQLADCLGLTAVHVNRVLKPLVAEGLLRRAGRTMFVADRAGLARAGSFDADYLHLPMNMNGDPDRRSRTASTQERSFE
jgi:CRP-like cAMP-binding protein